MSRPLPNWFGTPIIFIGCFGLAFLFYFIAACLSADAKPRRSTTTTTVAPVPAITATVTLVDAASNTYHIIASPNTPSTRDVRVEFYEDGVRLLTENLAPYELKTSWSDGQHTVAIVLYDQSGSTALASTVVTFGTSLPPPTTTTTVEPAITLVVQVTTNGPGQFYLHAVPNTGTRDVRVEFYESGTLLVTENSSPYEMTYSAASGVHQITAKLFNQTGTVALASSTVTLLSSTTPPPTTTTTIPPDQSEIVVYPNQSLQAVMDAAPVGATLALADGTWSAVHQKKKLHLKPFGNAKPIIHSPNTDGSPESALRIAVAASGSTYTGIEFWGGAYYCVKLDDIWSGNEGTGASQITFTDCKFHDSGRDCVKVTPGCDDVVLRRCEIYRSGQRDPSNAEGFDNVNGDRMRVEDCYIHDIATKGGYMKGGSIGSMVLRTRFENIGGPALCAGSHSGSSFYDKTNTAKFESFDFLAQSNTVINAKGGIYVQAAKRARFLDNTFSGISDQWACVAFDGTQEGLASSTDVTILRNKFTSGNRPNVDIRRNKNNTDLGWDWVGAMNYNTYLAGQIFKTADGFIGNLSAWKTRSGKDANSTEQ